MANVLAKTSVDMANLNLYRLTAGYVSYQFYDNINYFFAGVTYTDILVYQWNINGQQRVSYFYGDNFTLSPLGVTGGTVTAYAEGIWNGSYSLASSNIDFGLTLISIPATSLYQAAQTPDATDDYAILGLALNGNDSLVGSVYDDSLYGFNGDDVLSGGMGNDYLGGASGNDSIRGGEGLDTALYVGKYSDYDVSYSWVNGSFTITDLGTGYDGIDTVIETEFFMFGDYTTWTAPQVIDFFTNRNNGLSPIIWQNSQSGDVVSWKVQDNTLKSWGLVGSTGNKSPWVIEAKGNFDSNPGVDIVWKNSSTGSVYIWDIANNAYVGGGAVGSVEPSSGWEIVSSGYFNNDLYSDILWQNSITNDIYVWNIQNNIFLGGALIGNAGVNSGWQAKAVGEFDGKGNSDILWQNKFSGDVYIWNITNNQYTSSKFVGSVGANSGWEIKDTGYFNNDSYSDILWQNTITGDVYIWDIVNNAISGGGLVGSVGPNSKWDIQNAGLYNADSFSDILWHNSVTGEAFIWNTTNNAVSGLASLGAPSTQWTIAPVNSPVV